MNARLIQHLWTSPIVRAALKKEIVRLAVFIASGLIAIVCVRYFTGRSIQEGLFSSLIGVATVLVFWLVSVLRTVRRVLRENSLLE